MSGAKERADDQTQINIGEYLRIRDSETKENLLTQREKSDAKPK